MTLLIDAGNSALKFALLAAPAQSVLDPLPTNHVEDLSTHCEALDWSGIRAIWASNVAGAAVAGHLQNLAQAHAIPLHVIRAQIQQCGVHNGYEQPNQLGSDRWAALIAAWQLSGEACLVVNCGTATTIDTLNHQGEFVGGLILPGLDLMRRTLIARTAQLNMAAGRDVDWPCNSADAMVSGALQATRGAIIQQYTKLPNSKCLVFLSGGAARQVQERLDLSVHRVANLVLQGIALIAQENSK